MYLSKTQTPKGLSAVLVFAFAALLFIFGGQWNPNFNSEDKAQIQRIANDLCAAASESSCDLSWGGKSRWFGTLEPSNAGVGKVGLDHIRKALPAPHWQESSESNGVVFKDTKYEVFYSSGSGAVVITSTAAEDTR